MKRLTADLLEQFAEAERLKAKIKSNLEALGCGG
jgi:hypothetical protein